jgi:3-hydroxymyristoyl/3-hydroxydecanoyl-(acyl carrier protein) dehydratase
MQINTPENILENYGKWWDGHLRQTGQVHGRFLDLRQAGLRQRAGSIGQQLEFHRPPNSTPARALFMLDDLNEFATGSVMKCLGQEYAVYNGRRSLRIPNGDLLLMSRILSIQGRKREFDRPSSIVAEYDVPVNAWYFDGETHGRLPYSICIEVALQPCGFLSAYLGTPLRFPEVDYYFRNLDGETVFNRLVDARGKKVRARAELLKTIFYGSTIIQQFSFALECDGEVFFEGMSSFGYFSAEAMAGQVGLDGGKMVLPWLKQVGRERRIVPIEEADLAPVLPKGKLRLLDGVVIDPGAGRHQEGYVYANRRNTPQDWFYACHFHEDPVMPGSLGVEAIIQAMNIFAQQQDKGAAPAGLVTGQKTNWSYRGQVLQRHRQMQLEVHFRKTQHIGKINLFTGDASLWADDSRIYEVRNMTIATEEKQDLK